MILESSTTEDRSLSARERLLLAVLLASLFGVYCYSAYPTVSAYRDSGDLAAASCVLGVAHAPGYPLYVTISHFWLAFFRLGNPAYRLNLFSGFLGVVAAGLLFALVRAGLIGARDSESRTQASVAAGSFGALFLFSLSPAIWHLSIVSEMYSLLAVFSVAIFYVALLSTIDEEMFVPRLVLAALLFGLGLANHQTLILEAPAIVWLIWPMALRCFRENRTALKGAAGWGLGLLLAGLTAYAFLPVRSLAEPLINWGEPHTWRALWRMLTRADYGGIRLHPDRPAGFLSVGQWRAGLKLGVQMIPIELGWPGAALFMLGIWSGRRLRMVQASVIGFLIAAPIFIGWANLDPGAPETFSILEPHLVLPLIYACILAGFGAADVVDRARSYRGGRIIAAALIASSWIFCQRGAAFELLSYRNDFSLWDYGRSLAHSMSRDSVLLEPDDPGAFALAYLQACENVRPDIYPVSFVRTLWGYQQLRRRHPQLLPEWEIHSGQELYSAIVSHNIEVNRRVDVDLTRKSPIGFASLPDGIVYRLIKLPIGADAEAESLESGQAWVQRAAFRPPPDRADFFSSHTAAYWSNALNNLGVIAQYAKRPKEALNFYARALVWRGDFPEAWNNMGNAYVETQNLTSAEAAYQIARSLKPAAQVTYNLGRVFLIEGRYADAEREFNRALEEGDIPDARNDLGLVYLRTHRQQEAIETWQKLLDRYPRYTTALFNLGTAYFELHKMDDAKAWFTLYRQNAATAAERAEADAWLKKAR